MRHIVLSVVLLVFGTTSARASPALSDGFAGRWSVPTLQQPFAPAPTSSERTSSWDQPVDLSAERFRFRRARRLHRVGSMMTLIGGLTVIPLTLTQQAGLGGSMDAIVGVMAVASGGSYFAGGLVSSVASFSAVRAVNRALGLDLSANLAIGGMVASGVGWLSIPLIVGLFAPIVGVVCAAFQFRQIDRALDAAGISQLQLSPLPNGLAMSLRF